MRPEVSTNRPGKRAGKRANLIHRGGEQRWPPLASAHYQAALQLEVPLHPPERQGGVRPLQGQARPRRRAACRRRPRSRRVIRIVTVSGSELSGRGRGWGGRTSAQMRVAAYRAVCLDQHYLFMCLWLADAARVCCPVGPRGASVTLYTGEAGWALYWHWECGSGSYTVNHSTLVLNYMG